MIGDTTEGEGGRIRDVRRTTERDSGREREI